jgi:hypothetical protein
MPLKIFMALAAAAAICVGLALPVAQSRSEGASSQIELLEVGRG